MQLHVAGVPSAALTYVWAGPAARLMELEWSYEDFLANKAHRWGSSSAEYVEVDSQRAQLALPPFGRAMCEEWSFESGWVNLNHGSYGAAPNAVISAMRGYQERAAGAPDRFMRVEYAKDLVILRHRLSDLVQCDVDDLVMYLAVIVSMKLIRLARVPNATAGVNVVLRSLSTVYQKNDKLLYYSTTIYDACAATLQYIVDTHPHLNLSLVAIPLVYPVTHEAILATTAKVIAAENAKGNGKIRLALFDAISSMPGVIVPWEDLVLLFRQQGILRCVARPALALLTRIQPGRRRAPDRPASRRATRLPARLLALQLPQMAHGSSSLCGPLRRQGAPKLDPFDADRVCVPESACVLSDGRARMDRRVCCASRYSLSSLTSCSGTGRVTGHRSSPFSPLSTLDRPAAERP